MQIQCCSEVKPLWIHEVINSYATVQFAQNLLKQLAVSSPDEQGYSLQQGVIRLGHQIWVGRNSALRTKLIDSFHSTPMGGHSGVQATYLRIKKHFQWRGIKADVDSFVK
jgi:hypothetical protein